MSPAHQPQGPTNLREVTGEGPFVEPRTSTLDRLGALDWLAAPRWALKHRSDLVWVCGIVTLLLSTVSGWAQDYAGSVVAEAADKAMGDPGLPVKQQTVGPNAEAWLRALRSVDATAAHALALAEGNADRLAGIDDRTLMLLESEGSDLCVAIGGLPGVRPHPKPKRPGHSQRICTPLDADFNPQPAIPLLSLDELRTIQGAQLKAAAAKAKKKRKKRRRR